MTETTVLEKIKQILKNLPESMQIEVLHYAEYLDSKYVQQSNENIAHSPQADNSEATEEEKPKKPRLSGSMKGTFVLPLPDDFDEPLEEFEG